MPIGLVAAGVGAAGAIGGAIISGNAADSAAQTSANASTAAQNQQAQQFAASQQFLQQGAANANTVQTQQHDATTGALLTGQNNALAAQNGVPGQIAGIQNGAVGAISDLQNSAFNDASGTARGLYDNSIGTINSGYQSAKAANQPYLTAGASALNQLAGIYGLDTTDANGNTVKGTGTGGNIDPNATFYQTPDYQFALTQGIKGTDAGAAARGMLDSGATRKAEIQYAGNLASGQFNNYASRLAGLAGIGQTAVGNNAAGTTNYVNAITNANNAFGQQYANLRTGTANNIGNAVTGAAGNIGSAITGAANNASNIYTGTANQIAGANNNYATQYGNAQLGVGTSLANNATSYANNYATQVQNAAANQANAQLYQGQNASNALNGLAGTTAQYLNSNPNIFGTSYTGNGNGEF